MNLNEFQEQLNACIIHLEDEFSQIRSGRASPELLAGIRVEAYGVQNPLKNIANISVGDAKTLLIQPWDKSLNASIAKEVSSSDLGVYASVEGEAVRVKFPDLTEDRRREFVKLMKERSEHARVSVRNVRQKFMKEVEDEVKGGLSEDEGKRQKDEIEKGVKTINEKIEELKDAKEKELLTV